MKQGTDRRGFTLIELMVVVLILGILASIAIYGFANMQDRAKEAGVRSNAHTVQMVAEDFAALEQGVYASSIAEAGALSGMSMNDLFPSGSVPVNPWTQAPGVMDGAAVGDEGNVSYGDGAAPGEVYVIFGAGKGGQEVIRLSNGNS